jgi:pimeloyl-ACP methyl ester carboxylesterase
MEAGKDLMDFKLHLIQKPTLIVWGKEDKLIPLAAGEEMHSRIANSNLLVVQGCGHLAPSECPKPILKGVINFLKSQPPVQGERLEVPEE